MSGFIQLDSSEADEPPPSVQWQSWPMRDSLPAGAMVVGGLMAAGASVGLLTAEVHLALLAVGVIAIALWRFFIPASFELNTDGVSQWLFGRRRRIPWKEIRRYEVCSSGVLLLPRADRCPIDSYRGLYLPWGQHRGEVLAQVRYHLGPPSGA